MFSFNHNASFAGFTFSQPIGANSVVIELSIDRGNSWSASPISYTDYGNDTILDKNDTRMHLGPLQSNTSYMFRLIVTGGSRAGVSNTVSLTTLE